MTTSKSERLSATMSGVLKVGIQRCADAALGLADEKMARLSVWNSAGKATDLIVLPSPVVPNHADRIADVIRLALRTDAARRRATQTATGGFDKDGNPNPADAHHAKHPNARTSPNGALAEAKRPTDELAILERVQRIASISERNARLLSGANAKSQFANATTILTSSSDAASSSLLSPDKQPHTGTATSAKTTTQDLLGQLLDSSSPPPSTDPGAENKQRLSTNNLQAFLAQAQSK